MERDATIIRFPVARRLRAEREREAARIASMLRHPSNAGSVIKVALIPGSPARAASATPPVDG
jgi:hypothetical protein